jgi:hypothetical protein
MDTCTAVLSSCALRHHYSGRRLLTSPRPHAPFPVERIGPFDIDIDIDVFVNCSWADTRWQYIFTHKQYIEHYN